MVPCSLSPSPSPAAAGRLRGLWGHNGCDCSGGKGTCWGGLGAPAYRQQLLSYCSFRSRSVFWKRNRRTHSGLDWPPSPLFESSIASHCCVRSVLGYKCGWWCLVAQRQTSNIWCPASRGHNKAVQLFVIISNIII